VIKGRISGVAMASKPKRSKAQSLAESAEAKKLNEQTLALREEFEQKALQLVHVKLPERMFALSAICKVSNVMHSSNKQETSI